MCWFVTIAVPSASRRFVTEVAASYPQLSTSPIEATPTARLFPSEHSSFEITHGGCSCDLYPEAQPDSDAVLEKERISLTKKGWSDTKIARAVESKAKSLARPKRGALESGLFRSFVCDLVQAKIAVRVFAHFYSGNQRTESVAEASEGRVSMQSFRESGFPPDTVVCVGAES